MQVKSIAERSKGKHSAILSTFIKLPCVRKIFVLSILEWPLKTAFTYVLISVSKFSFLYIVCAQVCNQSLFLICAHVLQSICASYMYMCLFVCLFVLMLYVQGNNISVKTRFPIFLG